MSPPDAPGDLAATAEALSSEPAAGKGEPCYCCTMREQLATACACQPFASHSKGYGELTRCYAHCAVHLSADVTSIHCCLLNNVPSAAESPAPSAAAPPQLSWPNAAAATENGHVSPAEAAQSSGLFPNGDLGARVVARSPTDAESATAAAADRDVLAAGATHTSAADASSGAGTAADGPGAGGGGQTATPRPKWRAVGAPMQLLDSPMEGTVLMGSPPKVPACSTTPCYAVCRGRGFIRRFWAFL